MHDDFAILAGVAASPAHPYALLEHLSALGLPVTRSTLYRRVEALVAQGWLQADDIRGDGGHYRRALTLSKAGRGRIEREAVALLATEPLESPLFSLAVSAAASKGEATLAKLLKPRMAAAARQLTVVERDARGKDAEAGRERRIAHLRADIGWLQGLMSRRIGSRDGVALERAS